MGKSGKRKAPTTELNMFLLTFSSMVNKNYAGKAVETRR